MGPVGRAENTSGRVGCVGGTGGGPCLGRWPPPQLRAPLGSAQTSFYFPAPASAARDFPLSHAFLVCPMETHHRLPLRVAGAEWGRPGRLALVGASCQPCFGNSLAEFSRVLGGAQAVNCPVCRQTYREGWAPCLPSLSLASTPAEGDNTNSAHLGMGRLPQASKPASWPAAPPK